MGERGGSPSAQQSKPKEKEEKIMSNAVQRAWEGAKETFAHYHQPLTPLDDLVGQFTNVLDLQTIDDAVSYHASQTTTLSWYDLYAEKLVAPWQKPNERHPEWAWQFKWHNSSPVPMESGNATINERENPSFRTYSNSLHGIHLPGRDIVWKYRTTDRYGVRSEPLGYSIVSGETPTGEKVAILANFSFTPNDTTNTIRFSRITAMMYVDGEARDWVNEYLKIKHQSTNTVEEMDDAKEDARHEREQARQGAKDDARTAALQF